MENAPQHEPLVVHELESCCGRIFVVDEGPLRHLRFGRADATDQATLDRNAPDRIPMPYLRAAVLATVLVRAPRRALVIGLGGGGFVRAMRRRFPGLHVDAVEIDPGVVRVARSHFGVREDEQLRIHVADGAAFLQALDAENAQDEYDVILIDAFDGPDIPSHLTTRSFYRRVAQRLPKDGIALANVSASSLDAEHSIARRFVRTFRGRCIELQEPRNDNRVLVGGHRALPERSEIQLLARELGPQAFPFPPESIARTTRHCGTR